MNIMQIHSLVDDLSCPLLNYNAKFRLHNLTKSHKIGCINLCLEKLQTEEIRVRRFWPDQMWKSQCWCFAESSCNDGLFKKYHIPPVYIYIKKKSSVRRISYCFSFYASQGTFEIWNNPPLNIRNAGLFASALAAFWILSEKQRQHLLINTNKHSEDQQFS